MVKKLLPMILGLVLAGGGFFAYTKFFKASGPVETPVQAQEREEKELAETKKQRLKDKIHGHIYSVGDPFVINLADPGLSAFVKLDVSLMVDADTPIAGGGGGHGATGPVALEEQTEIRDAVIDVISGHTSEELVKAEGRHHAKEEIMETINDKLPKTVVLEVFFSNFAIQATGA